MIEKTIDWLDSIMDYVSEKDKRLVCNFTNFDELVNDFKKAMKEEQDGEGCNKDAPVDR